MMPSLKSSARWPRSTASSGRTSRSRFSSDSDQVDAGVDREKFPVRVVPPAESWSDRALFHTVMRRPEEARAAIVEARKLDANSPGAYVADGLLFDSESKHDEAKAAYARAPYLPSSLAP